MKFAIKFEMKFDKTKPPFKKVLFFCTWLFFYSIAVNAQVNAQESNTSKNLIGITYKAYKAYEIRKLVIDQIIKAHPIKQQLADYWQENHHFKGFSFPAKNKHFSIDDSKGTITIDLSTVSEAFTDGDHITLLPEIEAGHFDWQCHSNVTSNLVPSSCQD